MSVESVDALKSVLRSQYHASLAMLRSAVEQCPEPSWAGGEHRNAFWHIAYHALFFTHLYLQPKESDFVPWAQHREEYQFLGPLPWPPHDLPKIGEPYTRAQILEYWRLCEAMIDPGVDRLDLDAPECGFWWYRMSKLEHQLVSLRHVQHHVGQLADRLRRTADIGLVWVGGKREG
jgi:hypothetical protein